jgi:hypothetical protein
VRRQQLKRFAADLGEIGRRGFGFAADNRVFRHPRQSPGARRRSTIQYCPIYSPQTGAQCFMDTTLNYAIGALVFFGVVAVALAFLVW